MLDLRGAAHLLAPATLRGPGGPAEGTRQSVSTVTRLWTVISRGSGRVGGPGVTAQRLVEEEQKLELDTAPILCMEERTVLERKSTRSSVTLMRNVKVSKYMVILRVWGKCGK